MTEKHVYLEYLEYDIRDELFDELDFLNTIQVDVVLRGSPYLAQTEVFIQVFGKMLFFNFFITHN